MYLNPVSMISGVAQATFLRNLQPPETHFAARGGPTPLPFQPLTLPYLRGNRPGQPEKENVPFHLVLRACRDV